MKDYIWLIYVLIVIFTFLPFLRIDLYFRYKKYHKFLYVNTILLIWAFLIGLRFVINDPRFIYYASLSVYPVVFAVVLLLFVSVHDYLEIKLSKIIKRIFIVLFVINFITAITNNYHHLFIELSFSNEVTTIAFNQSSIGLAFYIHTIFSYILLGYMAAMLLNHFFKEFKKNKDFIPVFIVAVSFIFGIMVNIVHLFVFEFTIDPTLIAFVMFTNAIYIIFIIRDLNLIFQLHNNQFILDHYREMYLIVDINGRVVNASDELKSKFNLGDSTKKSYQEIKEVMDLKAVIYNDPETVEGSFDSSKIYLHMKEENINLPLFKYSGRLFLFYDETIHHKLMDELNYVLYHDIMTDLYNRNYFEDFKQDLERSKNNYATIIFDLDNLKSTNDHFGHKAGDELIINFAQGLKEIAKHEKKATPIRLGGDEFLLFIEDAQDVDFIKIIDLLKEITYHDDTKMKIGFSYGTAIRKDLNQDISQVLKIADEALYEMKRSRKEKKIS